MNNLQEYINPKNLILLPQQADSLTGQSVDNLVLHLEFEETSGSQAIDSSPSGENLGELRGAEFNRNSQISSVAFDGQGDYIHVNDSSQINLGIHAKRTVSLWFKVNDKNSGRKQVIYEEGGSARGLNIYINNGKLYVGGWNEPKNESGWQGTFLSTDAVKADVWHHVTLVLDAQEDDKSLQNRALTAYLDGKQFAQGQASQLWTHRDNIGLGAINGGTRFHDGNVSGTGTQGFSGKIDNVRIFNRALTHQEISDIVNSEMPTRQKPMIFRIEAEAMTLTNYRVEERSVASGNSLISFLGGADNETGEATWDFNGPAGEYEIVVAYFDENDGQASLELTLDGNTLDAWKLDQDLASSTASSTNLLRRTVSSRVYLQPGMNIKILGTEDGVQPTAEHARVDYLEFIPVPSAPIRVEAEEMTLTNYRVEERSVASGNSLISFLGGADNETGKATWDFDAPAGEYKAIVAYFDEKDGQASLELTLDGSNLDAWKLDRDIDSNIPSTNNLVRRTVSSKVYLEPGMRLEVLGIEEGSEHARVDYLEFVPVDSINEQFSNQSPVAEDDTATALKNTSITLQSTDLLENDSDPDGDALIITEVDNATNGSIVLSDEGNIIFTPGSDFTGVTSFDYTIGDGRGGSATATVEVTVLDKSAKSVEIGTNLNGINDWSTQLPFVDAFRSSRPWLTHKAADSGDWKSGVWNTNEIDQLGRDPQGWVTTLPAPEETVEYTHIGTLMHRDINGQYPGGEYVVLYDGEGTLEYGFNAQKVSSTPGRDVINVTPSNAGIHLQITATDPNHTGNYLRNIRVVPAAAESTYQEQVFTPEFLEKIGPFEVLRFMDWMKTNNSEQGEWSKRPTFGSATWGEIGAPVEVMVELANRTDSDPWFNMPHQATDEYITNFATYVRDHLDPELNVYVEYSNEVWNSMFDQSQWVEQQALQSWEDSERSNYAKKIDWYSQRTTQVVQIWDDVFGADKERVVGIMGAQGANVWTGARALSYAWSNQPLSHEDTGIDAVAMGYYFGHYLGDSSNAAEVESWLADADGGLKNLFDELMQGGVLSDGPAGGALQRSAGWVQQYGELTQRENLQLLAYEGGQHLVSPNNAAITNLFHQANRDPRMGEVYREHLNNWFELGGDLFVNFSDIARADKWGSWGALESVYQDGSPKYDALIALLESN